MCHPNVGHRVPPTVLSGDVSAAVMRPGEGLLERQTDILLQMFNCISF